MISKIIKRALVAGAAWAVIGAGAVSAQAGTIGDTGPDSHNTINMTQDSHFTATTRNQNNVSNTNYQTAKSGNAMVYGNTRGGSAYSGNASNHNSTDTQIVNQTDNRAYFPDRDNSYRIYDTGPGSHNYINSKSSSQVRYETTNENRVTNYNNQSAVSGNAAVKHNTYGGSAYSGNASNHNSTDTRIENSTHNGSYGAGNYANHPTAQSWYQPSHSYSQMSRTPHQYHLVSAKDYSVYPQHMNKHHYTHHLKMKPAKAYSTYWNYNTMKHPTYTSYQNCNWHPWNKHHPCHKFNYQMKCINANYCMPIFRHHCA